jgi:hypothetical protein
MERRIQIKIGDLSAQGELYRNRIADLVWDALPIVSTFSLWGDEIYFPIPVFEKKMENPAPVVALGDLGYWPDGHCFCIFYGLTPVSSQGEIKPASPVEVIGRLLDDPEKLKKVSGNEKIEITRMM